MNLNWQKLGVINPSQSNFVQLQRKPSQLIATFGEANSPFLDLILHSLSSRNTIDPICVQFRLRTLPFSCIIRFSVFTSFHQCSWLLLRGNLNLSTNSSGRCEVTSRISCEYALRRYYNAYRCVPLSFLSNTSLPTLKINK